MEAEVALALTVVTAGVLAMPVIARRLAVPVAVAEIGFGVVVGVSGLGLVGGGEHDVVRFLADLGFALFLFVAALEIDVAGILRTGARAALTPVALSACVVATALMLGAAWGAPAWLGLAIGVSSVPLAMAVLREQDLLQSSLGQRVILAAGAGELFSIFLIAMFDVGAEAQREGVLALGVGVLRALVPVAATVAAAIGLRTLLWWYPAPFVGLAADDDPRELGVRAGFALMFAGIAMAVVGGIEPLLGAFFAGLVVAYVVRDRHTLERKLSGVAYGFFVPVFFVDVGARLLVEPSAVVASAGLIGFVLLAMLLSRVPVFVGFASTGLGTTEAGAAALLLASPLTLQIAVAELGVRNGIFGADVEGALVIAAVIAGIVYPALARRLLVSPGSGAARPAAPAPRAGLLP